jgi:arylsulfatase A-like enzyme
VAERPVDRRKFLVGAAAAGVLGGIGLFANRVEASLGQPGRAWSAGTYTQPNIVFIVVDELRLPRVFPAGISSRDEFLAAFMPNLYELWSNGVKFEGHQTSGTACSPGRAALVTGLYPHQNWLLQTRKGAGGLGPNAPAMKSQFPTYGKILRAAGYQTPYVGKWHLSDAPASPSDSGASTYLQEYGFEGLTMPDVVGANGDGFFFDKQIAKTATDWLKRRRAGEAPFCLTVGFVNPHDREYFWAGTEADRYNALFDAAGQTPMSTYTAVPTQDAPQAYGYPTVPPNWESAATLAANKPSSQTFVRDFTQLVWGGVNDDPSATDFTLAPYPVQPEPGTAAPFMIGLAPYSYWQKGLDSYTQIMGQVDKHIGSVVASVPAEVLQNTVFVVTSDHGDYAGAHGLISNKAGSVYEEAFNVPLVVADPSGRFIGQTDVPRNQLTASVDLLPLFASLGYGGPAWMQGELAQIYAERLDLVPLLTNPGAAGRDHLVLATDEVVPEFFYFNGAPRHTLGVRTPTSKLGVYADWLPHTATIDPDSIEIEYYDYEAAGDTLELDNLGETEASMALLDRLLNEYVPQQMQQPLPGSMQEASDEAKRSYIAYVAVLDALTARQYGDGRLNDYINMGNPF